MITQNGRPYKVDREDDSGRSCKAQQRLNSLLKSKTNHVGPKLLSDSSIKKDSVNDKQNFIYKVQNYEHPNTTRYKGKSSNAAIEHRGSNEYFPGEPDSSEFIFTKTIQNDRCKLLTEASSTKDNWSKDSVNDDFFSFKKTILNDKLNICLNKNPNIELSKINRDIYPSTSQNSIGKKANEYKTNKQIENSFKGTNEKLKAFKSSEKDLSSNNSMLKNKEERKNTVKRLQQWVDQNQSSFSEIYLGNKQFIGQKKNNVCSSKDFINKTRPLKISEALEQHSRENELNPINKTENSKNIFPKDDSHVPSGIEKFLLRFDEDLKISEFHEDYLVENLEKPRKRDGNICVEGQSDRIYQAQSEISGIGSNTKLPSHSNISQKFTDTTRNSQSFVEHDNYRSRSYSYGNNRFSLPSNNLKKDLFKNTTSQINSDTKKRDSSTKNLREFSKAMPSKLDNGEVKSTNHFVPWDGFQKKAQQKVTNDRRSSSINSASTSNVTQVRREPAKVSHQPSARDIYKEYNASHQKSLLRYAKSFSDFGALMKSLDHQGGKKTTQNNCSFAQGRLLSCKSLNAKTLRGSAER